MTKNSGMRTPLCATLAALMLLGTPAVAKEIPPQLPGPTAKPTGTPSAAAKRKVGFPHFSWARVPVHAHVGLGDGLKPEQYKFLADHYGFIAFTGGSMSREYRTNKDISFERIVANAARTATSAIRGAGCRSMARLIGIRNSTGPSASPKTMPSRPAGPSGVSSNMRRSS